MLPSVGQHKDELDTPLLCVDLDTMESNIRSVVASCREHGIDWRPHSKCHKSPVIAQQLIEAGAIGITCAKLGEAEVMARGGVKDILIANLIVGPWKIARLVELRKISDPIVCVDHPVHVEAFSQAFAESGLQLRLMIEIDIGLNRVGTEPGAATIDLARKIDSLPGVELGGIMGYEGHLLTIEDPDEKARQIRAALDILGETREELRTQELPCPIVSCGGTGSFAYAVAHPAITELQAGGGIFMDAFYRHSCQVTQWDYAMSVLTTVVSRPTADRAIIDAGRKTMDGNHSDPLVVDKPGISVDSLSAEHGSLALKPEAQSLQIGDRLEFIPGYSDMTCVLHDHMYGFRKDRLEVIWPLEGRGRLQ